MYFICIACLNGSELLRQNNNVQWTVEHGVRFVFKFSYQDAPFSFYFFILFLFLTVTAERTVAS